MKKRIALLLTLVLLAACASPALADPVSLLENASGFDLKMDIPGNAAVRVENKDDVQYTFITFADGSMPDMYLSVAPTEEYDGVTLASLSAQELDALYAVVSADFDDPSYRMLKTNTGDDYMLVEDNSQTDSAVMVLICDGYFIHFSAWNDGYAVLTDAETTAVLDLFNTLQIIDAP